MENVIIRRLKIDDADEISRIHSAITKKSVEFNYRRVIEEQNKRGKDASLVAETGGKVVGFMISYILSVGFGIEKSAWIAWLGVDPKVMGQGIGKRLAEETFKFYEEMGIFTVYTSVRWDHTDLLSFFKTLGFDRSNFINLTKALK